MMDKGNEMIVILLAALVLISAPFMILGILGSYGGDHLTIDDVNMCQEYKVKALEWDMVKARIYYETGGQVVWNPFSQNFVQVVI